MNEFREEFFAYLHEHFGICGHCGKRKCGGRASNSLLPRQITADGIVAAADAAEEKLRGRLEAKGG